MRFRLLLALGILSMSAAAQSGSRPERRIEYAQEFSISIPASWSEIEPSVLDAVHAAIRRAAPNAPEIKISHGFKASGGPELSFPWVAIIRTGEQVNEAMFETMDFANRTVDELTKKWESSGGTLRKASMNSMSYDKVHHLLWGMSTSTFSGVGDLQTLSGAYLTKIGSIQVHCYAKAADFVRDQTVCRQIIESVVIDRAIVLPVTPVK